MSLHSSQRDRLDELFLKKVNNDKPANLHREIREFLAKIRLHPDAEKALLDGGL